MNPFGAAPGAYAAPATPAAGPTAYDPLGIGGLQGYGAAPGASPYSSYSQPAQPAYNAPTAYSSPAPYGASGGRAKSGGSNKTLWIIGLIGGGSVLAVVGVVVVVALILPVIAAARRSAAEASMRAELNATLNSPQNAPSGMPGAMPTSGSAGPGMPSMPGMPRPSASASSSSGNWKTHQGNGYTVEMPGTPKRRQKSQASTVGIVTTHVDQVEAKDGAFQVGVTEMPLTDDQLQALMLNGLDAALDSGIKSMVRAAGNGQITQQGPISMGTFRGREVRFDATVAGRRAAGHGKVVVVNKKVIEALWIGDRDQKSSPDVQRFINSLQVTEAPIPLASTSGGTLGGYPGAPPGISNPPGMSGTGAPGIGGPGFGATGTPGSPGGTPYPGSPGYPMGPGFPNVPGAPSVPGAPGYPGGMPGGAPGMPGGMPGGFPRFPRGINPGAGSNPMGMGSGPMPMPGGVNPMGPGYRPGF
jgi:hypothetical protein